MEAVSSMGAEWNAVVEGDMEMHTMNTGGDGPQ